MRTIGGDFVKTAKTSIVRLFSQKKTIIEDILPRKHATHTHDMCISLNANRGT